MPTLTRLLAWLVLLTQTSWRWFGPAATVRFILSLPQLRTSSRSLGVVYDALGSVSFRRTFLGHRVTWAHADIGYVWEIFDRECYTSVSSMRIGEHDTVVDVGANVGVFTVFAALHSPRGRVIAVEPNHANFERLDRNVAANRLTNVEMVNAALSVTDGTGILWRGRYGTGSDSLIRRGGDEGGEVPIISPGTLLSRFGLDRVNFLKMDIEGAEYQLFSGDLSWLERVERVALEAHVGFGQPRLIEERLAQAGFRVIRKHGERVHDGDLHIYAVRDRGPNSGRVDRARPAASE